MGTYGQKSVDVDVNLTLEENALSKLKEIQEALNSIESLSNIKLSPSMTGLKSLNRDIDSFAKSAETLISKMNKLNSQFQAKAKNGNSSTNSSTSGTKKAQKNLIAEQNKLQNLYELQAKLKDNQLKARQSALEKDKKLIESAYQEYNDAGELGTKNKNFATSAGKLSSLWDSFSDKYSNELESFSDHFISLKDNKGKEIQRSLALVGEDIEEVVSKYSGKYKDVFNEAYDANEDTITYEMPEVKVKSKGRGAKAYNSDELENAIKEQKKAADEAQSKYNKSLSDNDPFLESLLNISSNGQEIPIKFTAQGTEELNALIDKIQQLPEMLSGLDLTNLMNLSTMTSEINSIVDQVDTLATSFQQLGLIETSNVNKKKSNKSNLLSDLTDKNIKDINQIKKDKRYSSQANEDAKSNLDLKYKQKLAESLLTLGNKETYSDSDYNDLVALTDTYAPIIKKYNERLTEKEISSGRSKVGSFEETLKAISSRKELKDAGFTEEKLSEIASGVIKANSSYQKARTAKNKSVAKTVEKSEEAENENQVAQNDSKSLNYKVVVDTSEIENLKSSIEAISNEPIPINLQVNESSLTSIKESIESLFNNISSLGIGSKSSLSGTSDKVKEFSTKVSDSNIEKISDSDIKEIKAQTAVYSRNAKKAERSKSSNVASSYKDALVKGLKSLGNKDSYKDSDYNDLASIVNGYESSLSKYKDFLDKGDGSKNLMKIGSTLDEEFKLISGRSELKDSGFTQEKLAKIASEVSRVSDLYKGKSTSSKGSESKVSTENALKELESSYAKFKTTDKTTKKDAEKNIKALLSSARNEKTSDLDDDFYSTLSDNIKASDKRYKKGVGNTTGTQKKLQGYLNGLIPEDMVNDVASELSKGLGEYKNRVDKGLPLKKTVKSKVQETKSDTSDEATKKTKTKESDSSSKSVIDISQAKSELESLKSLAQESFKGIVLDLDVSKAQSSVNELKTTLKELEASTKEASKTKSDTSDEATKKTKTLSSQQQKLKNTLSDILQKDASESLDNEFSSLSSALSKLGVKTTRKDFIKNAIKSQLSDMVDESSVDDVANQIASDFKTYQKKSKKASSKNKSSKTTEEPGNTISNSDYEIKPTVNTQQVISQIQSALKSAKFEVPVGIQDDSKALEKQIKSVVQKYGNDAQTVNRIKAENKAYKDQTKELQKRIEGYQRLEKARIKATEAENKKKEENSSKSKTTGTKNNKQEEKDAKKKATEASKLTSENYDEKAGASKQLIKIRNTEKKAQELLRRHQDVSKDLNEAQNNLFSKGQNFNTSDYNKILSEYNNIQKALNGTIGDGESKITKGSALGKQIQSALNEKNDALNDAVYKELKKYSLDKNSKYKSFDIDKDSLSIDTSGMTTFEASVTKVNGEVNTLKMSLQNVSDLMSNMGSKSGSKTLSDSFFDSGINVTATEKFNTLLQKKLNAYKEKQQQLTNVNSANESGNFTEKNGNDLSENLARVKQEAEEAAGAVQTLISEASALGEVSDFALSDALSKFEDLKNGYLDEEYDSKKISKSNSNMASFEELLSKNGIDVNNLDNGTSKIIPLEIKVEGTNDVVTIEQKIKSLKDEASAIDLKINTGDYANKTELDSLLKSQESKYSEASDLVKKYSKGEGYVGTINRKAENYWKDVQEQITKNIESQYPDARNIKFKGLNATFDDGNYNYKASGSLKAIDDEISALKVSTKAESDYLTSGQKFISGVQSKFKSIGEYLTGLNMAMSIMTQIREGFSTISTLDSQLTNINKTMGVTAEQLNEVKTASVDMGVSLGKSSTDVLDAVSIYANANETATSIVEKAKPTVMLSNASGADTSTAADQIQGVINQFEGLEGQETRIVNSYEKISAGLAIDFAKGINIMSEGVANAGSVADQAGLTFEQFASSVGKVSEKTRMEGSTIGNAYKTILARTSRSKSADEDVSADDRSNAAKALKSIGIDVYNANGEYQDFSVTLDQLSSKWDGLSDAAKAYVSEQMAGVRNLNVMTSIIETWQDAKSLASEATTDTDFIDETQQKHMESLEGRVEALKASLEEMWVNVLNTDVLQTGLSLLTQALEIVNKILDAIGQIGDVLPDIPLLGDTGSIFKTLSTVGAGYSIYSGLESKLRGGSFLSGLLTPAKGVKEIAGNFINQIRGGNSNTLESSADNRQNTITGVEKRSRLAGAINGFKEGFKSNKQTNKTMSKVGSSLAEDTTDKIAKSIESNASNSLKNTTKYTKIPLNSKDSKADVLKAAENSYESVISNKNKFGTEAISQKFETAIKNGEELNHTYNSLQTNTASFTNSLVSASNAVQKNGNKLNSFGNGIRGAIQGFTGVETALSGVSATTIGAVSGLAIAATGTIAAIKLLNSSTDETSKKADEATESYQTQRNELEDNKSTISGYKGELANLISGVSKAGKNVSLSTDQFKRYHEICNDIADKLPSLVKGYDSQGNAILNLSSDLSELDIAYNKSFIKNANENLKNLGVYKENLKNAMGDKSTGTVLDDALDFSYIKNKLFNQTTEDQYGSSSPKQVKTLLEKLQGMSYKDFQNYQKKVVNNRTSSDEKAAYNYLASSEVLDFSNVKNKSDWKQVLSQIPGQIQTQQSKIDEAAEGIRSSMQSLLDVMLLDSSQYPEYKGLGKSLQENLNTVFSNMDADTLEDIVDPTSYVEGVLKKIKKNPRVTSDLNELLSFDSTGMNVEQQSKYIKNRLSSVADALGYKLNKNGTNSKLMDLLGLGDADDAIKQYQKIQDSYVKGIKLTKEATEKESSSVVEKYSKGFTTTPIDNSQVKKNNKLLDENTKSNKKNAKAVEKVTNSEEEQASRLQKLNKFIADHNIGTASELKNLKKLMSQYQKNGDVDWNALNTDYDYKSIDLSANETALEKLESNIETVTNNLSTLQSAKEKAFSSSGMSSSEIASVENIFGSLDGYDRAKLFESTSAGIKMNNRELSKLNEEYKSSEIKKYTDQIDKLKSQYKAACQEAGDLSKSATEVNEALSKRDSLKSQLESAIEKRSQIEGQTNAVTEWERALSGSEIGDTYDSIYSSGISGAQARWEKGEVGTNEFQSFVKMFSDPNADYSNYKAADYANLYEGAMAKAQRYFTEEAGEGASNFLTDLQNINSELASVDENGDWKISGDIESIASAMGISEGATEAMIEKLRALGFEIDQTQESDFLKQTREDAQATFDTLDQATKDKYGLNMEAEDLEGIDDQINKINQAIEEAGDNEGLKDQLETIKDYYETLKGEKMDSLIDFDSAEGIQKLEDNLNSLKEKFGEKFSFDIDWSEDTSDYYKNKKKELKEQLEGTDAMTDGKWNTNSDGFQEAYNEYSAIRKKQQEIENGNNVAFKFDTSNLTDASKKVVEDQQSIIEALQNNKNLKQDVDMGINVDASTVNQSTSSVIDQIRSYCQANNIDIPVDADCSSAETSVNAISQYIQGLDNETVKVQVQAEMDSDNSAEDKLNNIKSILEENGIEIPVSIEQEALNEQLSTLEQAFEGSNTKKWLSKNTETSDSENEATASLKLDGADEANSKLDELNSKLEEFQGDFTANIDVDTSNADNAVSGLSKDKNQLAQPTSMQITANGSQAQSTVSNLKSSKTTLQNPLTMLINAAGNALSQTNQIKSAKSGLQSPTSFLVSVIGSAIGTLQQIIGQKQEASTPGNIAMNVSGDAAGTLSSIMGLVQQTDGESADPTVTAVDNASGVLSSIIGLIASIQSKTVTVTVNKQVNTTGGDDANGTANVKGTAHYQGNALANGTVLDQNIKDNKKNKTNSNNKKSSIDKEAGKINKSENKQKNKPIKKSSSNKAYARGTWGASNGGLSLMGELGREIVVMRTYIVIYM